MLRTFVDTTDVGDNRWGPHLMDEHWHAICHAIFKGVEGAEWRITHDGQPEEAGRREKEKQIDDRSQVRSALWETTFEKSSGARRNVEAHRGKKELEERNLLQRVRRRLVFSSLQWKAYLKYAN